MLPPDWLASPVVPTIELIDTRQWAPYMAQVVLGGLQSPPPSVYEAAQVDGCAPARILWRIALPLVRSGLAVAGILAFVFSWSYFLFAHVLSNGDTETLIALPPLALAAVVQRWLVAGLSLGAIKG